MKSLYKYYYMYSALLYLLKSLKLLCVFRLEWPVRALSFSYDGKLLASASEDLFIDIADVETGVCYTDIQTSFMFMQLH